MLSIASYTRDYIDTCRSTVDMTVAAYENLGSAVKTTAGIDLAPVEFALASFEPAFYNHMVLALDGYFSNRARNKEGKDGNPLNEVRMLCGALMQNNGRLEADRTIKWRPETTVLGYQIGDEIRLTTADFSRLSKAFFAELESKYLRA
jgi:hypothetical protein